MLSLVVRIRRLAVKRLRDLLRERGGRALSDCACKLELTRPWAIYQLNSDLSEKTPNFKNWFIKIGYKDILAWVFILFLTAFKIKKCSIQIIHGNWKNTYADFVSEGSKNVYNRSRRRLLSSEWFLKFMFDFNSTKFKHQK